MHGIKRILVFCTLTTILPILLLVTPLYLRHNFYANVAYAVTDSDILEITDGISPIFCSAHTLQMNRTFNAFQMTQKPETTSYRRHIRLKKNMTLPDDTLEYWGFYLLKGATVALSVCSRFQGASILVVKGERNLRTCGMLEHHNTPAIEGIFLPQAKEQVKVTFRSNTDEVGYNSTTIVNHNRKFNDAKEESLWHLSTNNTDKNILTLRSSAKGNLTSNKKNPDGNWKTAFENKNIQQQLAAMQGETTDNARKIRHAKRKQDKKWIKERRATTIPEAQKGLEKFTTKKDAYAIDKLPLKIWQTKLELEKVTKNHIDTEMKIGGSLSKERVKRNQELVQPTFLLDQGIKHGGNAAKNASTTNNDSSVSSFENELFTCYGGSILIAQEFAPSEKCTDVTYLLNGKHMQAVHNVVEDGYYYYIFYSDNDIISNDLYALFDIYKPVLRYENVTKSCINETTCSFSIDLLSSDKVIVEIPTKDNFENEIDDINLLLSVCIPRMEVYIIFPIAVLFLILACAFM